MKTRISLKGFAKTVVLCSAIFGLNLAQAQVAQTQVFLDWSSAAGSQNFFQKSVTKTDGSNNVFIAGATVNSAGNYDIMVAKYSPDGALYWYQQYAGSGGGNDFATSLTLDGSGNVIITGSVLGSTASDSNDVITIKYNSSGVQQFVATYHGGTGSDIGTDVIADGSGNIYVAGSANKGSTNKFDAILLKYNSSGTQQWVVNYDYNSLNDGAYKVKLLSGKIGIAAVAQNSSTNYKLAIVKYDASGGFVSSTVSGNNGIGFTMVHACAVDNSGNMYITGSTTGTSSVDYYTIKLDSALNQLWTASYNGASNLADESKGIVLDASGNVYVTGYSTTSTQGKDYVTIKYNSSGTQQWAKIFNGEAGKDDEGNAIAIDASGNPVVTGASDNGDSYDYYTIKYDGSTSNVKWQMSWNNGVNKADRAMDVAVDVSGAVIVTGQATLSNGTLSYITVKYVEKSVLVPTDAEPLHPAFFFTENRGQIYDTDDKEAADIKFYNKESVGHVQLYYTNSTLSYVFARLDTATTSPVDSLERIDMSYLNGEDGMRTYPMDVQKSYMNYFQTHIPEGRCRVKNYSRAFVSGAYDRIDVVHASNGRGLKYYYIVKPGGDPANIEETYSGANSVYVDSNGDLVVEGILGSLRHPEPKVWQVDNSGNIYSLSWTPTYNVTDSSVTLSNIGAYNSAYNLIIQIDLGQGTAVQQDPNDNLDWASHFGSISGGNTAMYDVDTDADSCSYYSGSASGSLFPTTSGVFQVSPVGNGEGSFQKFYPDASLAWCTFLGGPATEGYYRLDLDTAGNIYFVGKSQGAGTPMAQMPGAYFDNTYNGGGEDYNIGKLSNDGTQLLWSTYFGGNWSDAAQDILVTPSADRLYILGFTSSTNFPYVQKTGAYNINSSSRAVITEFNASMDTVWSSHFGTSASTYFYGITGNVSDGFFIIGDCNGGGIPYTDPGGGAHFDQLLTGGDAMIVRIDANDSVTWCTLWGGAQADFGFDILMVAKDVYICGHSNSSAGGYPLLADTSLGEYYDFSSTGMDAFIARFSVTGVLKWSTFFGGTNNDQGNYLAADKSRVVYMTGQTLSYDYDMEPNGNAYQQLPNIAYNEAFFAAFTPANALLWSTGFGGTHYEGANEMATVGNEWLYFSGFSQSDTSTFPWDFPVGGWIDTFKVGNTVTTGYVGRFGIQNVNVGVAEAPADGFNYLVYPNPTADNLTVDITGLNGDDVEIVVFDLLGQVIVNRKRADVFGTLREDLDFSTLTSGVYMVVVKTSGHGSGVQKVIKQ